MKYLTFILLFFLGGTLALAKDNSNLAAEVKARLEQDPQAAFSWIESLGHVTISTSETEIGLEAAKLNLKLAIELEKPADKVAAAYWLLSALALALEKFPESLSFMDQSNYFAQQVGDKTVLAYGKAFIGLIYLSAGNHAEGIPLFESGTSLLEKIGSEDAKFYLGQLAVGRKIFVKNF